MLPGHNLRGIDFRPADGKLYGVSNKMRSAAEVAEGVRGFERDVLPALASGHVRPVIDRVFPFKDLPKAKAHMESNAHLGKIAIVIP